MFPYVNFLGIFHKTQYLGKMYQNNIKLFNKGYLIKRS